MLGYIQIYREGDLSIWEFPIPEGGLEPWHHGDHRELDLVRLNLKVFSFPPALFFWWVTQQPPLFLHWTFDMHTVLVLDGLLSVCID